MGDRERGKRHGGQQDIKGSLVLSQYLLRDDDHREALVIFCANPQPFEAQREMRTSG